MDEIAGEVFCLWAKPFFGWVSLNEQNWVISRERRGEASVAKSAAVGTAVRAIWQEAFHLFKQLIVNNLSKIVYFHCLVRGSLEYPV